MVPFFVKGQTWDVLTKKGTILRLLKIWVPFWDFDSKMGTKDIIKPLIYYVIKNNYIIFYKNIFN